MKQTQVATSHQQRATDPVFISSRHENTLGKYMYPYYGSSKSAGHVLPVQEQTGPRRPAEWEGDYSDAVGGGWWAFPSPLIGDLVSGMSRKGPKSIV